MYNANVSMEIISKRYSYSKQHRSKKSRKLQVSVIFFILLILISGFGFIYSASARPLPGLSLKKVNNLSYIPDESVQLPWSEQGQSAIGSINDGVLEIKNNQDNQAPIASMAKIITALVVLDKKEATLGSINAVYKITQNDIEIYNQYVAKLGSVMPVQLGQELTLQQLLQGLLLPSGNNAADYLAIWTFGSLENYKTYANQYLKEKSLTKTFVDDASGFSPQTVSSPSDMIVIGQMALKNSVINEIVRQKSVNIPGSGEIKNTNYMLNDERVVGIKTGNTDEAGKCLIFAVKYGKQIDDIAIILYMGHSSWPSLYNDALSLEEAVLKNFGEIELLPNKKVVANLESKWGEQSNLYVDEPLKITGWKRKKYQTHLEYNDAQLPIKSKTMVGTINVKGYSVSAPIYSENSINRPSLIWKIKNYW